MEELKKKRGRPRKSVISEELERVVEAIKKDEDKQFQQIVEEEKEKMK